jgi:hypothetical protein
VTAQLRTPASPTHYGEHQSLQRWETKYPAEQTGSQRVERFAEVERRILDVIVRQTAPAPAAGKRSAGALRRVALENERAFDTTYPFIRLSVYPFIRVLRPKPATRGQPPHDDMEFPRSVSHGDVPPILHAGLL